MIKATMVLRTGGLIVSLASTAIAYAATIKRAQFGALTDGTVAEAVILTGANGVSGLGANDWSLRRSHSGRALYTRGPTVSARQHRMIYRISVAK